MRWARHWVLPDPAPASTSRLTSRRSRIRSRAAWSGAAGGRLGMRVEPPVGVEYRVVRRELGLRALAGAAAARAIELAVAAILIDVGGVDEGPLRQHVEEVAEHHRHLGLGLRWPDLAVRAPAGGREVVGAERARLGVALAQQLGRHQRVKGVLELSPAAERSEERRVGKEGR